MSTSLAEEMLALARLLEHPDVEWNDILDSLACTSQINSQTAALELHGLLKIDRTVGKVACSRLFWEEILRQRRIDGSSKVRDATSGSN
jgi:hypothetical protein